MSMLLRVITTQLQRYWSTGMHYKAEYVWLLLLDTAVHCFIVHYNKFNSLSPKSWKWARVRWDFIWEINLLKLLT